MKQNTQQQTGEGNAPRTMGYIEAAEIYGTDEAEEYRAEQEEADRAQGV